VPGRARGLLMETFMLYSIRHTHAGLQYEVAFWRKY
jgi:hypothetical protein